jgi:hypothetical protein
MVMFKNDFDFQPPMRDFMDDIKKTIIKQPDFTGIGGHGPENYGSHGVHSQVGIGLGETHNTFRDLNPPSFRDFGPPPPPPPFWDGRPQLRFPWEK